MIYSSWKPLTYVPIRKSAMDGAAADQCYPLADLVKLSSMNNRYQRLCYFGVNWY